MLQFFFNKKKNQRLLCKDILKGSRLNMEKKQLLAYPCTAY